jgi:3-hydroxyacyl-[acyl-carrier protein] dehydratase/trans-2-decenoyl-[acyl-carrier protein] isomerase
MFDRICQISRDGRTGHVVAEQDIQPDAWYFQCHFEGDPVQPGCLGVDALWQLLGFFAAASGGLGSGRALGCGHVEFMGQIRPYDQRVRYELTVRRFAQLPEQGAAIVIGNGRVLMGDDAIYNVADAKVGLFRDIAFTDYPNPHAAQATGGLIQRT